MPPVFAWDSSSNLQAQVTAGSLPSCLNYIHGLGGCKQEAIVIFMLWTPVYFHELKLSVSRDAEYH